MLSYKTDDDNSDIEEKKKSENKIKGKMINWIKLNF